MSTIRSAGVIGAGAWGTALARVCAAAGLPVTLWAREAEVIEQIAADRENRLFLPGVKLDPRISATGDMAALKGCDMVLAVAPAQHLRALLVAFEPHWRGDLPVILCAKGIEASSLKLMTQVAVETLGEEAPLAVLSGPSFAGEEQVSTRSPRPQRPATVSARPPRATASRVSSANPRVIRAAWALRPRPRPSTMPQPMARTFFTEPPISAPTMSSDR